MGGSGSGRWYRSGKKTVVEDCKSLDANRWTREGILRAGVHRWGKWTWTYGDGSRFPVNYEVNTLDAHRPFVRLWYSWTWAYSRNEESEDYSVRLTTTHPPFGGVRWWFVCPLVVGGRPCCRRVGKLFLPSSGRHFGCRRCHDLTYTSCQMHDSRVDALVRNPELLDQMVKRMDGAGPLANLSMMGLLIDAQMKVIRKMERKENHRR